MDTPIYYGIEQGVALEEAVISPKRLKTILKPST